MTELFILIFAVLVLGRIGYTIGEIIDWHSKK